MSERDRFMQDILDKEWEMFQEVKSAAPASCQSSPDTFRLVRGSIFQLWPAELMAAYLMELTRARRLGRNLLTEKYARMDNLISPLTTNPALDKIVDIETRWQDEIRQKYPALYQRACRSTDETGDGSNFSIYLKCELETYGDAAIDLYYDWVHQAKQLGVNYSLTMLNHIVLKSGFKSIDDAETFWAEKMIKGL
jgi:hypothetical protein